jgi:hypothetical protein
LENYTVLPIVIILNFKSEKNCDKKTIILCRDSVNNDNYRKLSVLIRFLKPISHFIS